jgi:DNA-binding response OmpR family regulator
MKQTICIIDDDEKLNQLLKDYLSKFGFAVFSFTHPEKGLQFLKQNCPDIIILDIMLPDMDGFEVCRKIRDSYHIPIIMLTARGEVTDRVVGLELGADDYLPKPFEPRELVARIQAILRRGSPKRKSERIHSGQLILDLDRQTVVLNNQQIGLTTTEFEILSLFLKHPGKVLTRDQIMDHVRGIEWSAFDRSIDVLVSRVRQKLHDNPKKPIFIKTIWGKGYKFIGEKSAE